MALLERVPSRTTLESREDLGPPRDALLEERLVGYWFICEHKLAEHLRRDINPRHFYSAVIREIAWAIKRQKKARTDDCAVDTAKWLSTYSRLPLVKWPLVIGELFTHVPYSDEWPACIYESLRRLEALWIARKQWVKAINVISLLDGIETDGNPMDVVRRIQEGV